VGALDFQIATDRKIQMIQPFKHLFSVTFERKITHLGHRAKESHLRCQKQPLYEQAQPKMSAQTLSQSIRLFNKIMLTGF